MLVQASTGSCAHVPHLLTLQHSNDSFGGHVMHQQLQPSPFQTLSFPAELAQLQPQHVQGSTAAAAAAAAATAAEIVCIGSAGSSPKANSNLGLDLQRSGSLCGANSAGSAATPSSRTAATPAFAMLNSMGSNAGLQQQQQQQQVMQQQLARFAAVQRQQQQQQQVHVLSNGTCVRLQPTTAQQHVLVATPGLTPSTQPQQLLLLQPQVQQQVLLPPSAAAASSASSQQQQQVVDSNSLLKSPALSASARRAFEEQLHEAYNSGYAAGFSDGVEAGRQQKRWR
jgi:hypothetical protein